MTPLERALRVTNITTEEAADVAAAIKAHAEEAVEAARKVWEDEVFRPAVEDMRRRAANYVIETDVSPGWVADEILMLPVTP